MKGLKGLIGLAVAMTLCLAAVLIIIEHDYVRLNQVVTKVYGDSSAPVPAAVVPADPVEPKWAADLRAKAASMGLQFSVHCTKGMFSDPDEAYMSYAKKPEDQGLYVEDGALPSWHGQGRTVEAAARSLRRALDKPPNWIPEHKPKEAIEAKKKCERGITGGPGFPQRYATDEKCKDCEVEP